MTFTEYDYNLFDSDPDDKPKKSRQILLAIAFGALIFFLALILQSI